MSGIGPKPVPVLDRLLTRVEIDWRGCWLWQGYCNPKSGYGQITANPSDLLPRTVTTHTVTWTKLVGPVPDGLQLDHLCRVRRCCNTDHLEPVLQLVNMRRGAAPRIVLSRDDRCEQGHALVGTNVVQAGKYRRCRACRDAYMAAYRAARAS